MGWTFTSRRSGRSVAEFFREEFGHDNEHSTGKVLDCAVIDLSEAYMAYEKVIKATGERYVVGLVCLIRFNRGYHNFGYKDMDENMGPFSYRCPERILNLLTPTDNENALEWRRKCRERIAAAKARPSIRKGDVIVFPDDLHFSNGDRVRRFIVVDPKGSRYTDGHGFHYRIRRNTIRHGGYEIQRDGKTIYRAEGA